MRNSPNDLNMKEEDSLRKRVIENLRRLEINPDKNFKDQHLTVSEKLISEVIEATNIVPGDHVLEIGPGLGQFSEAVLKKGAKVTAIEIDKRFSEALEELKRKYGEELELIWGSALKVNWPENANKIVMNPPFSILERLLEMMYAHERIEVVSMIIGKRYCQDAMRKPGSGGFGKSALMTQAKFTPTKLADADSADFYPPAGEKIVAMKLVVNKKPNPILRVIANFFVNSPETSVKFVIMQALEYINKRARKYKKLEDIITVGKLGIRDEILNKRLQDLGNFELNQIVQKLISKFNIQKKSDKRKKHFKDYYDDGGGDFEDN